MNPLSLQPEKMQATMMKRFDSIRSLREFLHTQRGQRQIGLVPTMGALHEGHITLIEQAKATSDLVVSSVFVNPVQFNNPDDLARYPRTLDDDCQKLEAAGCDAVFAPSVEEMYPEPPALRINFGELETVLEGAFRPGHFNGVGIVVARLFNIVQPDRAYFGQKDLQQVAVIRRLVRDLGFPIELVRCPTVREADGLAMSSRNRNLTSAERQLAPVLYQGLSEANALLLHGASVDEAKAAVVTLLETIPAFRLEYVEVVNADTLQPVSERLAPGQTAICIAAHLGHVRLIDNVVF